MWIADGYLCPLLEKSSLSQPVLGPQPWFHHAVAGTYHMISPSIFNMGLDSFCIVIFQGNGNRSSSFVNEKEIEGHWAASIVRNDGNVQEMTPV